MSVFVNQKAIERRKAKISARESDCRTVNHAAIEKRKEPLKQANMEEKPPENKLEEVLSKDVLQQIVNEIGL